MRDFPGGTVDAGDLDYVAGPGRSHMPWSD